MSGLLRYLSVWYDGDGAKQLPGKLWCEDVQTLRHFVDIVDILSGDKSFGKVAERDGELLRRQ